MKELILNNIQTAVKIHCGLAIIRSNNYILLSNKNKVIPSKTSLPQCEVLNSSYTLENSFNKILKAEGLKINRWSKGNTFIINSFNKRYEISLIIGNVGNNFSHFSFASKDFRWVKEENFNNESNSCPFLDAQKMMVNTSYESNSSPLKSNKLLDNFHRYSYLHLSDILNKKNLESIKHKLLSVLKDHSAISSTKKPTQNIVNIKSDEFYSVIKEVMKIEEIHRIPFEEKLLKIVKTLLKTEDVLIHPRKMFRWVYPYSVNPLDKIKDHQDFSYVKGNTNTLTIWIPLEDYEIKNGTLRIYPESQNKQKHYNSNGSASEMFKCQIANHELNNSVEFNVKKGDVIIFNSLTVHGSLRNLMEQFRFSIDTRISKKSDLINHDELKPPYFPSVPDFNILSKNWHSKKWVLPQLDESNIHHPGMKHEDLL